MSLKTKKSQVVIATIDQPDQNFHFLLLQTNQKRGSFWQNVTVKIEQGETFEEGGLREAIEETGLKLESIVDILDLGLKYEFTDSRGRSVNEACFLIILDSRWEVKIDPHEHQNFKWVGLNEINPDLVKYPSNFEPLKKAQHILKHWGG